MVINMNRMDNRISQSERLVPVTAPVVVTRPQEDLIRLRLDKLNEEEQYAKGVASMQQGEQSRLAGLRLEHIRREQQELLKQLAERQSGTSFAPIITSKPIEQPKQRNSSFVNASFGDARRNGSGLHTPVKSSFSQVKPTQYRSAQNNNLEPVDTGRVTKISEKRERKSSSNWVNASFTRQKAHTESKSNSFVPPPNFSRNFTKQSQPVVQHIKTQSANPQKNYNTLSEKLGNVILSSSLATTRLFMITKATST